MYEIAKNPHYNTLSMEGQRPEELASGDCMFINSDLYLKMKVLCEVLGIDLLPDLVEWNSSVENELIDILSNHFPEPIFVDHTHESRERITVELNALRQAKKAQGSGLFILSLDPILVDPDDIDYLFQMNRIAVMERNYKRKVIFRTCHGLQERYEYDIPIPQNPDPVGLDDDAFTLAQWKYYEEKADYDKRIAELSIINLEHLVKREANRTSLRSPISNRGDGKQIDYQIQEFNNLYHSTDGAHIALVDGITLTGRSVSRILQKTHLDPGKEMHFFTTVISKEAFEMFADRGIQVHSQFLFTKKPKRIFDLSELLPTLGGRAVGIQKYGTYDPSWEFDGSYIPKVVGGIGRNIIPAVDPLIGGYPWQIDINPLTDKIAIRQLQRFALQRAHEFWSIMEKAAGRPLEWDILTKASGLVKVFLPIKNGSSIDFPLSEVPESPKRALEKIMLQQLLHIS